MLDVFFLVDLQPRFFARLFAQFLLKPCVASVATPYHIATLSHYYAYHLVTLLTLSPYHLIT